MSTSASPPSARLRLTPPLRPWQREVVASLAGAGAAHRIWSGQPGVRSPWRPCDDGCCLVLHEGGDPDAVDWLRFLVREVLAPRAAAARRRASAVGLTETHRVGGDVPVATQHGPMILRVVRGRVTLCEPPVEPARAVAAPRPTPRLRGEVVQRDPPDPPGRRS